jgi:hypothetical protein
MTAQIPDFLTVDELRYEIAGAVGTGLFHPKHVGIEPVMLATACYRGFICEYECRAGHLVLSALTVRAVLEYPEIEGVRPVKHEIFPGTALYALSKNVPFNGGLLCVANAIPGMTHRIIAPNPPAFRNAVEYEFREGAVIHRTDHSARLVVIRARLRARAKLMTWTKRLSRGAAQELDAIAWSFAPQYRDTAASRAAAGHDA